MASYYIVPLCHVVAVQLKPKSKSALAAKWEEQVTSQGKIPLAVN